MTNEERNILIKTAELLYSHGYMYAASYIEEAIDGLDLITYERTGEPLTDDDMDTIAECLELCDEHGLYGTGDLLVEIMNGTYTAD